MITFCSRPKAQICSFGPVTPDTQDLPLLFDGAHAFGGRYKGKPLGSYGDACMFSFHATKIFHCVEGGGICINTDKISSTALAQHRNFGIQSETEFSVEGTNAKMSEMHAAMGLTGLENFAEELAVRQGIFERYTHAFQKLSALRLPTAEIQTNNSYFPVLISDTVENGPAVRDLICAKMWDKNIFVRKYFYPALHAVAPFNKYNELSLPITESAAGRVFCLPIYSALENYEVDAVIDALTECVTEVCG